MKIYPLLLLGWLSAIGNAATSDIFFPTVGAEFPGKAGNIVFNGQEFVAPCVQSNGAIQVVFLDTNAVAVANVSLSITGSTPRIALNGGGYLLAWLETNAPASVLKCAAFSNAVLAPAFAVITNVAEESVSLSAAGGSFLAVFQSAATNSTVFGQQLGGSGQSIGDLFAIAPSAQTQVYPSVGTDGTNHLVCWMEQNVTSNDWLVVARLILNGAPLGTRITVSPTNSLRPHRTACSFGTNYLVAWSWDEGPMQHQYDQVVTNLWHPMVHGRICSPTGIPQADAFIIGRNRYDNTNVAIVFGDKGFVAAWINVATDPLVPAASRRSEHRVQPLRTDGSRAGYSFQSLTNADVSDAQIGYGTGRFLVLYPRTNHVTTPVLVAPRFTPDMRLINVRRTNGGIAAESSVNSPVIETSTNLIDWVNGAPNGLFALPRQTNHPRLFVRQFNGDWKCIDQLRAIDWAKQQWALDTFQSPSSEPSAFDLFGPTRYLEPVPSCPYNGVYTLAPVGQKPTCNMSGHKP